MEFNEVDLFLRLKEDWKPFEDNKSVLPTKPVGVPGAHSPAQMHPHHQPTISPAPSPLKGKGRVVSENKKDKQFDAGEELGDSKLQGVNVDEDDLLALVEELGLGGDDASDLVKGLGFGDNSANKATKAAPPEPAADEKQPEPVPKNDVKHD